MTVCCCDRCCEPDPVCEHGVATYDKDCPDCAAIQSEKFYDEVRHLRNELSALNNRRATVRDRLEHLTGVRS